MRNIFALQTSAYDGTVHFSCKKSRGNRCFLRFKATTSHSLHRLNNASPCNIYFICVYSGLTDHTALCMYSDGQLFLHLELIRNDTLFTLYNFNMHLYLVNVFFNGNVLMFLSKFTLTAH